MTIPLDDYNRAFELRCRSKRGEYLRPQDMVFLEALVKKYPKEYGEMDKKVFDATKPFGAI